ncbi:hypothetical protein HQP04_17845 [Rhodococcus fascians]|nr:hypothetical protein [Rhodococcus fascians]MBY4023890.1 hypothetical protein [Rhodococcus fascians]
MVGVTFTQEVAASDSAFLQAKIYSAAAEDQRRDDVEPGHPEELLLALGDP